MMDLIINNFAVFSRVYMQITIEIVFVAMAIFYAYWIRPFTVNHKAAFAAAGVYWIYQIADHSVDINMDLDRIIAVAVVVLISLIAWYIDERRNPIQKLFLTVVYALINWVSLEIFSEIGFYERDLVFQYDFFRSSIYVTVIEFIVWNILQYGASLFTLYIAIKVLHKAYRNKTEELSWQEFVMLLTPSWSLLLVKPIISSYFHLWMDGISNGSIKSNIPGSFYRILFCISSYFSVLIIIKFYQEIKNNQEKDYLRISMKKQIEDMRIHLERVEELYDEMRAMRHDIGNHLTVVERLAETGNTEELSDYINEWKIRFFELQPQIKSGNAVTDLILSEYNAKCARENIPFECSFKYPGTIGINPFDMCVILSNALQNAFDASCKMKAAHISISSVIQNNLTIINIKNKMQNELILNEEGIPYTTKSESGHGYGLRNIRSIAQKYKGDIEIKQEYDNDGITFVLNIMLLK